MTSRSVKLDIDVTREKLDALGLGYASGALDTLLSEAVSTEMSAHQCNYPPPVGAGFKLRVFGGFG